MFDFLSKKFSGVLSWLKDKGRLSEENINEALNQVRDALLEADVPYNLVEDFLNNIKNRVIGDKISSKLNPGQYLIKIVNDELISFLGGKDIPKISFQIPSIIMVMGLQGSGKTTTIGKLAYWVINEAKKRHKERKILLASVDFYRPAAIDQLEIVAKKINADFYRAQSIDPVKASVEIYNHFKNGGYEYLFLDTAGRLHVDNEMMCEIRDIDHKLSPRYKILVLDAMTGQESLKVAQAFESGVGFTGVVLSKMDSDTRGGAAFAFRYALKKPIYFVGSGEKPSDLEAFVPERMASKILGMGDMLTLLEKASDDIDKSEQEALTRRIMSGHLNFEDFAQQLDMVNKLGSLSGIAKYLPNMGQLSPEVIEAGQKEANRFKAIIASMTVKERRNPSLMDGSRKLRIAKGSGTSVEDINKLIQRLQQGKQFAKMFKRWK